MDSSPVPAAAPRRRRRVRTFVIGALAAVLLVGGGVVAAGGWLGWFGEEGTHPYDVMPASTMAYVQLDLDPSLEQQAQAWAFLRDLPAVAQSAPGQPDPRRVLWSLKDRLWVGSTWTDYDQDLAPWLGDRIGVGIFAHETEQVWVTAIQVIDEAKAVAKLREWIDATGIDYDVTVREGYAIISASSTASVLRAEQDRGLLGRNQQFSADLRSVGGNAWMAGWVDFGALAASSLSPSDDTGRAAFSLRFSADSMEFSGRMTGWNRALVNGSGQLGALPASTGSAVCASGYRGDGLSVPLPLRLPTVPDWWHSRYGFDDDDVAALLGRSVCLSSPDAPGLLSAPDVLGLRVTTDDPARAQKVLDKGSADIFGSAPLVASRVDGDVVTAATTRDYLAELAEPPDPLSARPAFTRAVPDSGRAALTFYVDLQPLGGSFVEDGSPNEPFVSALQAVGGQYFDEGAGNGSWSVRVVRT